jgi:hypothetical protein
VRYIKAAAKEQWHKTWRENKTAQTLQRIMKGKYAKTSPRLYNEMPNRNAAAKIAQTHEEARTGCIGP